MSTNEELLNYCDFIIAVYNNLSDMPTVRVATALRERLIKEQRAKANEMWPALYNPKTGTTSHWCGRPEPAPKE